MVLINAYITYQFEYKFSMLLYHVYGLKEYWLERQSVLEWIIFIEGIQICFHAYFFKETCKI